jgi:hypothetical protein
MVCVGDFCEGVYFIFFMFGLIVDEIGNGSSALRWRLGCVAVRQTLVYLFVSFFGLSNSM